MLKNISKYFNKLGIVNGMEILDNHRKYPLDVKRLFNNLIKYKKLHFKTIIILQKKEYLETTLRIFHLLNVFVAKLLDKTTTFLVKIKVPHLEANLLIN